MIETYLKRIFDTAKRGDATEESFYPDLKAFLEDYTGKTGKSGIHITTLPKRTEAGNPDFRVWDGRQKIVGYIEAKPPTQENLDYIEGTDQLKRYRHTFPNLILTNFFEFRLYRHGELIDRVLIARPFILHKIGTVPPVEKGEDFLKLLEQFFSFSLPRAYTAHSLAVELAKRTRFLRDEVLIEELKEEETKGGGFIIGFYEAFKTYLIGDLSKEDFADLYAQTITYGLFAARTRSPDGFNRRLAFDSIPRTIGILRDVFRFISLEDLPSQMEWTVDDISDVLATADVREILHRFYREGKGRDPIIHFYETFLAEYDPEERMKRGVYYTPEPVVSYIVRSLHLILKEDFKKGDGFATNSVTVLDPASGTLTFLAEASRLAVEEFISKYGEGGRQLLIKDHILKNFYAFELMMAPYAVGHLKMGFLLEELGYRLKSNERFNLYLTNTLEMEELEQTALPGMSSLSEESHLAGEVKKQIPILVILGNPPYSVSSVNKSEFIEKEMEIYKEDVRGERNIQPLSDDYIKFIRFAHYKIEQAKRGVIGMITNNSYLSGLIHRGMRRKLLESFDKIYILNLHGNVRIGEKTPDGSKDENVFDIMQGVAIALFIKNGDGGCGRIFYRDVYGLRDEKYRYLVENDIKTTEWKELEPIEPYFFFVPKDFSLEERYKRFWGIPEIFNLYSSGVKTHRDHFVVGFTEEELKQRMRIFTGNLPDEMVRTALNLKDTHDFNLKEARELLRAKDWRDLILPYSYRPFDNRYICYSRELIDRDRYDVMRHFVKENLGLVVMRQYLYQPVKTYNYVFCVNRLSDQRLFISNRGAGFIFPLYLYKQKDNPKKRSSHTTMMLFEPEASYGDRIPNLNRELIEELSNIYGKEPAPEDIFYYIYAILYSNTYRIRYAEFLKIDFPRVPFTEDYGLFTKMAEYGKRLVDLHLMRSSELNRSFARFQGSGDDRITKLQYNEDEGRVYINNDRYFEGIEKDVWEYQIGGYQVLEKWLKDRKGRRLNNLEDIKHYCKIALSLKITIEIQGEIDELYSSIEKGTISFNKQA